MIIKKDTDNMSIDKLIALKKELDDEITVRQNNWANECWERVKDALEAYFEACRPLEINDCFSDTCIVLTSFDEIDLSKVGVIAQR